MSEIARACEAAAAEIENAILMLPVTDAHLARMEERLAVARDALRLLELSEMARMNYKLQDQRQVVADLDAELAVMRRRRG